MRKKKGFTLMEMLLVVAIIAVLVAVAIPVVSTQLTRARETTCQANRRALTALLSVEYMAGDGDRAAVAALFEQEADGYPCPSGGRISYAMSATGVITLTCDVHTQGGDTDPGGSAGETHVGTLVTTNLTPEQIQVGVALQTFFSTDWHTIAAEGKNGAGQVSYKVVGEKAIVLFDNELVGPGKAKEAVEAATGVDANKMEEIHDNADKSNSDLLALVLSGSGITGDYKINHLSTSGGRITKIVFTRPSGLVLNFST